VQGPAPSGLTGRQSPDGAGPGYLAATATAPKKLVLTSLHSSVLLLISNSRPRDGSRHLGELTV